jgi:hypothetical protein
MKSFIVLILIAVLAVAAYMTNPPVDQHREAAKQRVGELTQASMGKESSLLGSLGAAAGKTLATPVLAQVVNSENYYLFSTTTLTWNNVANVVGVGAFGRVFLGEKFNKVYKNMLNAGKAEE